MADESMTAEGRRVVRAALEFRPDEYEAIKAAAYASGLMRSKFYSIAISHLSGLSAAERQRVVAEYLTAESEGA